MQQKASKQIYKVEECKQIMAEKKIERKPRSHLGVTLIQTEGMQQPNMAKHIHTTSYCGN
jgi:hypothetical protein